mmetsp:Transcript_30972/g.65429  ORF Transcript_30972/g.65429 Transcript_30972/m.65429 type:complete len:294 (-) Transcript_30972:2338-3219(-)
MISITRYYIGTIFLLILQVLHISGDDYTINPDNKSLLIAAGCFWCAEQAFEQYAPGVIEAKSGYAGANGIDNPTYRNHPGHYEVILIEYNPLKTTYKLLVEYAWFNLDPFDGGGQFCDNGFSYLPAIFYANEEERVVAEQVKDDILKEYPNWDVESVVVPLLERPTFWTAEDYHQNYYIENPRDYGFYKERCGRTDRLKDVWGEEEYYCYHDFNLERDCFNGTVVNEDGEEVEIEVNVKNASEEVAGVMPTWAVTLVSIVAAILGCGMILSCTFKYTRKENDKPEIEKEVNDH